MAAKVQRWIDLLAALLRNHYAVEYAELCSEVPGYLNIRDRNSRRRAFERDKDELRQFGIPIATVKDGNGEVAGYSLKRASFYLPYLSLLEGTRTRQPRRGTVDAYGYRSLPKLAFDEAELEALVAAAEQVALLGDPNLTELAQSAMRKLSFDLPIDSSVREAPAPLAQVMQPRSARPAALEALDEAVRTQKRVKLTYRTMANDQVGTREVEPFGLFFINSHWYLAANDDGTVKNFRVSRVIELEVNARQPGTPDFTVPDGFDLREHARSRQAWEMGDTAAVEAMVTFTPRTGASHAAARLGAPVPGRPGQRRFQVRRIDAFARWLLTLAGEAAPLSPPELVREYGRLAADTRALYAEAAPS